MFDASIYHLRSVVTPRSRVVSTANRGCNKINIQSYFTEPEGLECVSNEIEIRLK